MKIFLQPSFLLHSLKKSICQLVVKEMCTKYWLTACGRLTRSSVVRISDHLDVPLVGDGGRKSLYQANTHLLIVMRLKSLHINICGIKVKPFKSRVHGSDHGLHKSFHYKNLPVQYTEIFFCCKNGNLH